MTRAFRFGVLFACSLIAWGLWIAEVRWVKGWGGLAWLAGFNWSAIPICILVALMCSYLVSDEGALSARLVFIGVASILMIVAFAIARWAMFELFSAGVPGRSGIGPAIVLLTAWLIVSFGLTVATTRSLAVLHYWAGVLVAAALIFVLPLSFLTIKVFPALNGSMDQIHSIKMGYPVFWTALLVPVALRMGKKHVHA